MVCIVVMIAVSLMTKEPDYNKIAGLTYGTVTEDHLKKSRSSWTILDVIFSAMVVAIIIFVYLYFRG
jgi:SSS family solute:Na+ symporter